jgi:hypothetical protein
MHSLDHAMHAYIAILVSFLHTQSSKLKALDIAIARFGETLTRQWHACL